MNKKQKYTLYKNAGLLVCLFIICAVLARCGILNRGETLQEHAQKQAENKEIPMESHTDITIETDSDSNTDIYMEADSDSNPVSEPLKETSSLPAENAAAQEPSDSITKGEIPMSDRITYKNGFYYESLNEEVKKRITGISYPNDDSSIEIRYDDLCYVNVLYYDFNDKEKIGELICNKAIAGDLVEIFYELYRNNYQIEKIRLVDEYQGDDELSMRDNNSSCFNYRNTTTGRLSNHALGLAVDINPFFNPYITYNNDGSANIYPAGSEYYVDRENEFAYKIDKNDLAYQLFTEHGFTWGGNWNSCKDYQHFEKK